MKTGSQMRGSPDFRLYVLSLLLLASGVVRLPAFSLLGPYESWMDETMCYRLPGDIGGPMAMSREYRWNVPVVTYGFDASFLDYFGHAGVTAVEEAVGILNALPPISAVNLNQYPLEARQTNATADTLRLVDLKSAALKLLIEQIGLASPTRFVWTPRWWGFETNEGIVYTNFAIVLKNFDPLTFGSTTWINSNQYAYALRIFTEPLRWDAVEILYSSNGVYQSTVADWEMRPGQFLTSLTQDDMGGLHFLLRTNNWNWENLLPGVGGAGTNANDFVNTVARPGVDKITFVRLDTEPSSGAFTSLTNTYVETWHNGYVSRQQTVQRIISRPDILFSAEDLGISVKEHETHTEVSFPMIMARTDTSNWENNSALDGWPGYGGPGIIRPPITISFGKLGRYTAANLIAPTWTNSLVDWGSFDGTTNAPVTFQGHEVASSVSLGARVTNTNGNPAFEWRVLGTYGARYRIDWTSDLATWTPLLSVTNSSGVFLVTDMVGPCPRFYRAVKQE